MRIKYLIAIGKQPIDAIGLQVGSARSVHRMGRSDAHVDAAARDQQQPLFDTAMNQDKKPGLLRPFRQFKASTH